MCFLVNVFLKIFPFLSPGESPVDVKHVQILHERTAYKYSQYEALCKRYLKDKNQDIPDKPEVQEYANFVGKKCAKRMLLYRKSSKHD